MIQSVSIVGAGTMGSGIALAASMGEFPVVLCDINPGTLQLAKNSIEKNLQFLLDKQKISATEKERILQRIVFTGDVNECVSDLVVEAIVEKLEIKIVLFQQLAAINSEKSILASNTSSLSITALQQQIIKPYRVAGLHFFNPAHMMKLVEIVKGEETADNIVASLENFCSKINKVPVICKDAPGFIVNRVARHYYLEAMRIAEQQGISFKDIDAALEAAGFKMGPFKLMDLIGMDINLAVSQSLYDAFEQEARFKPSVLQMEKVNQGALGRKTGKGFYEYNT
jgi:3-hydroxybutyryl-CoA dehydrogenase